MCYIGFCEKIAGVFAYLLRQYLFPLENIVISLYYFSLFSLNEEYMRMYIKIYLIIEIELSLSLQIRKKLACILHNKQ